VGLVLRSDDVAEQLGWFTDEVHNYPWVELSWGEWRDLLPPGVDPPTERITALRAAKSHILMRGFSRAPEVELRPYEVLRLVVPPEKFEALANGLRVGFSLSEFAGAREELTLTGREGTLYPSVIQTRSSFPATRWYANLLADAGCPVERETTRIASLVSALQSIP
jgi:hypothetical protein